MIDLRAVERALRRTRDHLLSVQSADGSWTGRVESDPRITAFYLGCRQSIGRGQDERTHEMEAYLRVAQLECGGWEARPGGGPDAEVTAACALGLGRPATAPGEEALRGAERWLATQPIPGTDLFWKGYLAIHGEVEWTDLPYVTPRLVSIPRWLHPNLYDFSFARMAVVSLALIEAAEARPSARHLSGGLDRLARDAVADPRHARWKESWIAEARRPIRGLVPLLARATRWLDSWTPVEPHRTAALEWLLDRQGSDGAFFSSVHMTTLAISALHAVDQRAHRERIEAALEAMHRWQVVDHRGRRQQFTDATNWDTALCLDSLRRLGVPPEHEKLQRARDFLLARQSLHAGDWSQRAPGVAPGGWSFQRFGELYPDVDDSALIVRALLDLGDGASERAARRCLNWILGMQGASGGWASWDRDERPWIRFRGAGPWLAEDRACADITARAVALLARVVSGCYPGLDDLVPSARRAVRRGLGWLGRAKEESSWFGAWFTHYLYGTSQVLEAYREAGFEPDHPEVRAAREWIVSVADSDGAYGESTESARWRRFASGPSTPFHTACALSALTAAGAAGHAAAERAARWLVERQSADGTWANDGFFAAGTPGLWYADFALTCTCMAARSLASFCARRAPG